MSLCPTIKSNREEKGEAVREKKVELRRRGSQREKLGTNFHTPRKGRTANRRVWAEEAQKEKAGRASMREWSEKLERAHGAPSVLQPGS